MAIANPLSITYGTRELGGTTSYAIHGPYVIDKSFESLRLVFDVVITAESHAALHTAATDLETDLSLRDQDLEIDIDGSTTAYVFGEDILNTRASLAKSGLADTDQGFSRAYTCIIEGDLPAQEEDKEGLRDVEMQVAYEAGRQKIVTMRGTYTAGGGITAVNQYAAEFDGEASTLLAAVGGADSFELVAETHTQDRNIHLCHFSRQYVQLLENQTQGALDATNIRDHRVTFTDLSQHPGDSRESIHRLRRVIGSYDCAIDIDQTTDLQSAFSSEVKPHVIALFQSNFSPQVFAIEEQRIGYDETSKRMSVSIQFLYQKSGGDEVIEVAESMALRESRTVDYTPTHSGGEFDAYADLGWATLEQIHTRTVYVMGEEAPKFRIAGRSTPGSSGPSPADRLDPVTGGGQWIVLQNTSQVTPQWIGDPDTGEQIRITILNETVILRYNQQPPNRVSPIGSGGTGTGTVGPTTGPGFPLGNNG